MECIDAVDTGVEISDIVNYQDTTGLSQRIKRMNPHWNVRNSYSTIDVDQRLEVASKLCGKEFSEALKEIVEIDLPAREIVEESMKHRYNVDKSGEIICWNQSGLPWRQHLYDLERKYNCHD